MEAPKLKMVAQFKMVAKIGLVLVVILNLAAILNSVFGNNFLNFVFSFFFKNMQKFHHLKIHDEYEKLLESPC
jgi:hypothetical protein